MKTIFASMFLLSSLACLSQEPDILLFDDWYYDEIDSGYNLYQRSGLEVSNCNDVPELWINFNEKGTLFYLSFVKDIYPNYYGDEVKVQIKLRKPSGEFGDGDDLDLITFESVIRKEYKSFIFLTNGYTAEGRKVLKKDLLGDEVLGGGNWEQIYFQLSLKNDKKVVRYSLKGYTDAFNHFKKRFKENINPF